MRRRWLGGKRGGDGGPTAQEVAAAPSPLLHLVGGDTTVVWRLRRHRLLRQIWREGRGCGGDPAMRGAAINDVLDECDVDVFLINDVLDMLGSA
uniref:Uncharacterized protein n=1 Tax=Oryza rufipogon TaxID=4529 RepID=A0A0E0NGL9_ORYRU